MLEHLPERMRAATGATISTAYGCRDPERALSMLTKLARQLERKHSSAAASLREGLSETLTILSFNLDDALARTLATTNPIENLNSVLRRIQHNVKRWRDGTMVLRWVAVGLHEAMKFQGHLCFVEFEASGRCCGVEFCPGARVLLDGRDMMAMTCWELVRFLRARGFRRGDRRSRFSGRTCRVAAGVRARILRRSRRVSANKSS